MSRGAGRADLSGLERELEYRFTRPEFAVTALTHVSSAMDGGGPALSPAKQVGEASEGRNARAASYQRLEFLGDRVLGLAVSSMLYDAFPQAAEGELSRRLADLVRRESCAEVAAEWQVGPFLRLGPGEAQSGGRGRQAILADVCEAIIGAVFLDGGFDAAASLVRRAWEKRMLSPRRSLQDPKTALQEWAQGRGKPTPVYTETDRSGPAHAPRFVVSVLISGCVPAAGFGTSKRGAEQAAAEAFMQREGFGPIPPVPARGQDS